MNATNKILLGLLVVQAALLAVTWVSDLGRAGAVDAQRLFEAEPTAVTAFEVTKRPDKGEEPSSVRLERKGEQWVVAGADDFPADAKKVEDILDKLLGAKRREPIAETAASHNALGVGDTSHDKKVVVRIGDTARTLYVGNAKGTSLHARFEGEPAVWLARGISSWGIADGIDSYIDTAYVEVEDPTAVRVQNPLGVIELQKDDAGKWHVAQLKPGSQVDESRVRAFVGAARMVRTAEPVGRTVEPAYGLGAGATTVRLEADGKTVEYAIGAESGDFRYVKATDDDYVIKVRKYAVESLLKQTPDQFVEEQPMAPPGGMPGMPGPMPGDMPPGMPGDMPGELMMPPPGH